jgi:branched-chain amino acid transport system ATP-binding protein
MSHMLEAVGLNKRFGAVVAAADINIRIGRGERVSLIGSNGAGKTTFVNMVTGYLKPDTGTITLDGTDITPLQPRAITQSGVARSFQIPQLFGQLSVMDNMLVANACHDRHLSFFQSAQRREARDRVPKGCWSAFGSLSTGSGACPNCPAACASCWTLPWH